MDIQRPKNLTVDVSGIESEEKLIDQLIAQFDFPDLYGRSWQGMEEHLFYDPMMKVPNELLVKGIASGSCSQDNDIGTGTQISEDATRIISVNDVRTTEELELFLNQKYGDIKPLPSIWRSDRNGDRDSAYGDFRYQLSDGREIDIPGIYTESTGTIVDPEFDLRDLSD